MQNHANFLLIVLVLMIPLSCVIAPDYPVEPVLTYNGVSKNTIFQGVSNTDSLYISANFTDGDGDLGDENENKFNIFLIDNRTGNLQDKFITPYVPPAGASNGISGELQILVYTTCCFFPDNIPPCESPPQYPTDTISYDIYIVDRAGNESNHITTEQIVISCN